jgi:uncharacterized protein YjbI with pentapeptide repeats
VTVPEGLHWGYKFVGTDLATDDHAGGRYRYRLGEWHEAENPTVHDDPCPNHPGDGLCAARTLTGARSGGARIGTSVGLLVGYLPADVLAATVDKVRVSRLWVAPEPFDPVRMLICHDADLRGAVLSYAVLRDAVLRDADLRGAVLSYADLRDAVLRDADLRGADLRGAVLRGAVLRDAVLRDAVLRGADLRGADLSYADLRGADLRDADLRGADLRDADLRGAVLRGADLRDAVLRGAEGVTLPPGWVMDDRGYVQEARR